MTTRPIRALVFSHSCVIAVNQQIYVDLAALPDVDVALVLPDRWKSEYDGAEIKPAYLPEVAFPVFPSPIGRAGNISMHFYKRLPMTELRRWKPDIVLASQEPYSISGWQARRLARRLGVPFVFQTNQNILKRYPPPFSIFEQQAFRDAADALAYSEEAREVMIAKGRKGPTDVLPYATDLRLFQPRDTDENRAVACADLRRKLGLTENDFVIGYVGRLVPEKGLDTLLKAVTLLEPFSRSRVRVLLVGSGVAETDLRKQAKTLDVDAQVVFAGSVAHAEIPPYMAALDLFALPSRTTPSWKEQFGRVIIESLACGVPVVGSDSGQIPHLLRETGGGVAFVEGDASALAACLTDLIEHPEKRAMLAARGGASVNDRFGTPAVARRLRDILQRCLFPANQAVR